MTTLQTSTRRENDRHIAAFTDLPTPQELRDAVPADGHIPPAIEQQRNSIRALLDGRDDRLLVVVGPCSIHDPAAGLEYAHRLAQDVEDLSDELLIVMRTYFEKPRTTVGWKGLINDPHLDGTFDIATGLLRARSFLRDVSDIGLPCATEFLEPISPQYIADLVSWGAIGARTTESQIHRQLASGLSMPIGFKNGTDGSVAAALDAIAACRESQSFLGISPEGRASLVSTTGNTDTSLILRGGGSAPNWEPEHVRAAARDLAARGLPARVIIDASHGNSGKDHRRQADVAAAIAGHIAADVDATYTGVMLESNLVAGAQRLDTRRGPSSLTPGQSVTDACMGWDTTRELLARLADAAHRRRR